MIIQYFSFSISIVFISWIVGIILNIPLQKTTFYKKKLSNLHFIKSDRFNQLIGLDVFKWIVKNTFFKSFNQKLHLKNKSTTADLASLRDEMTISEISHLIAFIFVGLFAFAKFLMFEILFGCTLMITNIGMNLYPALLQQVNKTRIDKVIKKPQATAMRQKTV